MFTVLYFLLQFVNQITEIGAALFLRLPQACKDFFIGVLP